MSNIQYELFTGLEAQQIDPENIKWPHDSVILYALEENGENREIVGRIGIIQLPHIEGTWIREDKRNSRVLSRLISKVENILEEAGRTAVFSFADKRDANVINYLERLGYTQLPLKVYMKPLVDLEQKES